MLEYLLPGGIRVRVAPMSAWRLYPRPVGLGCSSLHRRPQRSLTRRPRARSGPPFCNVSRLHVSSHASAEWPEWPSPRLIRLLACAGSDYTGYLPFDCWPALGRIMLGTSRSVVGLHWVVPLVRCCRVDGGSLLSGSSLSATFRVLLVASCVARSGRRRSLFGC